MMITFGYPQSRYPKYKEVHVIRVGTVLPFSVFFGFRFFALFIRVSGRVFGPYLLREKSLYQLVGKNQGSLDYT